MSRFTFSRSWFAAAIFTTAAIATPALADTAPPPLAAMQAICDATVINAVNDNSTFTKILDTGGITSLPGAE